MFIPLDEGRAESKHLGLEGAALCWDVEDGPFVFVCCNFVCFLSIIEVTLGNVCVYRCIHIHHIHNTYIHTYMCLCECVCVDIYTCIHMYVSVCIDIYISHTCVHIRIYTYIHIYTYMHICVYVHMYIGIYIYMHIYTCIYTLLKKISTLQHQQPLWSVS